MLGEPGPQVVRASHDQDLAWLIVWVRSERALRLATIGLDGAVQALRRAEGPAGLWLTVATHQSRLP